MYDRLRGKVIAVAGGSGGIGSAVSSRLAAEGAIVVVGDIRLETAQETVRSIAAGGGRAVPKTIDIGDEASVAGFVAEIVAECGGIDGFYVNALDSACAERDVDPVSMNMVDYDRMMDINLRGYFLCTRHAVPQLVERGGGAMLYTSSGAAYVGMNTKPVYAMVKNGIHGLARHVARRYGKQGVRCNVIAPGLMIHPAVEAAMGKKMLEDTLAGLPLPRLGRPEDIAAMAALLLSDDGEFITGQVISVDGGATMRA